MRLNPIPTTDTVDTSFFPFTPICSLGCKPSGANANNWGNTVASWLPVCDSTAAAGYTFTGDLDSSTAVGEGGLHPAGQEGVGPSYAWLDPCLARAVLGSCRAWLVPCHLLLPCLAGSEPRSP